MEPDCNFFKLIGQRVKDAFLAAATYDRELTYLNMIIGKAKNRRSDMYDEREMDSTTRLACSLKDSEKSTPNWREAFEQVLAAGGKGAGFEECRFCQIAGVTGAGQSRCKRCPFATSVEPCWAGYCVPVFGPDNMYNSERWAICRHVLAPTIVKDFTDVQEIRDRIADMLDNDAREKFLGKAEPVNYQKYWLADAYTRQEEYQPSPDLDYAITINARLRPNIIAAFRDEATRDHVQEFLNADASENEEIRDLLNRLISLLERENA